MKQLIQLLLFSFCAQIAGAQTFSLKARTGIDSYRQMDIRLENGTAYIQQSDIAADESLLSAVYDLAGLGLEDGSVTIPKDDNIYWFVGFDGPEANGPVPEGRICFLCDCLDHSGKRCDKTYINRYVYFEYGCINAGCDVCLLKRGPCNSTGRTGRSVEPEITGPFVIIKADQIIFQ